MTLTSSQLSLAVLARRLTHQKGSPGWSGSWVWEIGETGCEWGTLGGSPLTIAIGSSRRNFGWCGVEEKAA